MSDEGKQILASTRNFRTYLTNIGQLLSTARAMLETHGYEIASTTAWSNSSTHISYPGYWCPQDAFIFFKLRKNGHILVFISVILDDMNNPDALEQPLVSAAWFKYGKEVGKNLSYNLSRIILSLQEYSLDGKMMHIPPEITGKFSTSVEILSSQALAVPLVDIQSERDIEEKIISPLVESLSGVIN